MNDSRIKLSNTLHSILRNDNIYYQPPESVKLKYPCIIYSRSDINATKADNINYHNSYFYNIILISKTVDPAEISSLMSLPGISFDRMYISDNLYHYVFTIFY